MDTITQDIHKNAWMSLTLLLAGVYSQIRQWDELEDLVDTPFSVIVEEIEARSDWSRANLHWSRVSEGTTVTYVWRLAECLQAMEESIRVRDVRDMPSSIEELADICTWLKIDIWDYYERIEACVDLLSVSESELIYTPNQNLVVIPRIILEVHDSLIKRIAQSPEMLYHISPRKFEEIIAEIFRKKGFYVELTKTTRDGGKDIIAIHEHLNIKTKYIIECKRYSQVNKVSIALVQRLLGVKIAEAANKAILATTSTFTRDARFFASNHIWDLDLKDYEDIISWIKSY